jgi:hypothetical protein
MLAIGAVLSHNYIAMMKSLNLNAEIVALAELHTTFPPSTTSTKKKKSMSTNSRNDNNSKADMSVITSPVCHPHFRAAMPNTNSNNNDTTTTNGGNYWSNSVKFKRLYFYHVRKAGGTNLGRYFEKVATHYGLTFTIVEYDNAEFPGSHVVEEDEDGATFYVTHLREPISRSISHFKYQGRWDCEQLVKNTSYVPHEDMANKLETWNTTTGHYYDADSTPPCQLQNNDGSSTYKFFLSACAVNCYSQWFSGLSCPLVPLSPTNTPTTTNDDDDDDRSMEQQYTIAKQKLLRYNFIVLIEQLSNPTYVNAVERFFGVPGVSNRDVHPWCEVEVQYTNKKIPVPYNKDTIDALTELNAVDIQLYNEMTNCLLQVNEDEKKKIVKQFPSFDTTRFSINTTLQIDHEIWEQRNPGRGYMTPGRAFRAKFVTNIDDVSSDDNGDENDGESKMTPEEMRSPACRPHFSVALPPSNGSTTNNNANAFTINQKFTRLYFYHTRKAGGTNLKQYFRKVAKHYGLIFDYDEYTTAEDPGSHDKSTFYVTNLREPVSRSISHFKYEGRWDCKQLVVNTSTYNMSYIPTEDNANTLEDGWITNYGQNGIRKIPCALSNGTKYFKMVTCGVMCYVQWFAGQSCPNGDRQSLKQLEARIQSDPAERERSLMMQYQVARQKLGRYNLIVISEYLNDPKYVSAIEDMFGVPGVSQRSYYPWCEVESHNANKLISLTVSNDTLVNLTMSNQLDTYLYDEYASCLQYRMKKDFPVWDSSRFQGNMEIQKDYKEWEASNPPYKKPYPIPQAWLDHPTNHKWAKKLTNNSS